MDRSESLSQQKNNWLFFGTAPWVFSSIEGIFGVFKVWETQIFWSESGNFRLRFYRSFKREHQMTWFCTKYSISLLRMSVRITSSTNQTNHPIETSRNRGWALRGPGLALSPPLGRLSTREILNPTIFWCWYSHQRELTARPCNSYTVMPFKI